MKKTALLTAAAVTFALAAPQPFAPAAAWGPDGHHIVCALAYLNLTPTAKAEVDRLTATDGHYKSFADSCTWPDDVRSTRGRGGEHFVNYPRSLAKVTGPACPGGTPCVISAIDADLATLGSPGSDTARVEALKWVGHWFGDIHQPLHISFEDDRGGNSINVTGACAPVHTKNLHAAWDSCILRERVLVTSGGNPLANDVATAAKLNGGVTLAERKSWVASKPWQWAAESYTVTLQPQTQYCVKKAGSCRYSASQATFTGTPRTQPLTAAYLNRAAPIVSGRLSRAGIRLADALNRALDPAYTGPK
jgi:nuclease S1